MLSKTKFWRTISVSLTVALGVAALSGCTDDSAQKAEERLAKPVSILWETKDKVVSDIEVLPELSVALAYVAKDGKLSMVARDLNDGSMRWEHKASTGMTTYSDLPSPQIIEHDGAHFVALTTPGKKTTEQLAVVEIESGKLTPGKGTENFKGELAEICADTWCTSGSSTHRNQTMELYYDWDTQRWTDTKPEKLPIAKKAGSRLLDLGLSLSPGKGWDDQSLSYSKDGKILWTKPYEEVFDKYYSTDKGWRWQASGEDDGILVGDGGRVYYQLLQDKREFTTELTKDLMAVGINAEDGKRKWAISGINTSCMGFQDVPLELTKNVFVACHFIKGVDEVKEEDWEQSDEGSYLNTSPTEFEWEVAGYDLQSGEKLWGHKLSGLKAFQKHAKKQQIIRGNEAAVMSLEDGLSLVNYQNGEIAALDTKLGSTVLCTSANESLNIDDAWSLKAMKIQPPTSIVPCERDNQKSTNQLPSFGEFQRTELATENISVVPGKKGMVAYQMPAA